MKHRVPAGSGDKMQYLVHAFNDNTMRFILRYPGLLDQEALRYAVRALVDSVDVLHAAFVPGHVSARWEVSPAYDDADCFTCLQSEGDPMALAVESAMQALPPDGRVQLRCILVQGQQESALTVLISHLCVDGGDGKYLLRKLAEACRLQQQEGSCAALAVKNGSRAAEQVYATLTPQERRALLRDPRTGVKSLFPFPTEDAGRPVALRRLIPAPIMADAHRRARALGATVNDLLLTVCYHAFADLPGVDAHAPMSISALMDLRRHCPEQDTQGLCNLSGPLSTTLTEGVHGTLTEILVDVTAQTRQIKEDPLAGLYGMPLLHGAARNLPMGVLLAAAQRLYGSMSVGLTNLGSIDCRELEIGGLVPAEGWFGGPMKRKPGMQVSAASFDGACALSIWGYAADEDLPLLHRLLDGMADRIGAFARE